MGVIIKGIYGTYFLGSTGMTPDYIEGMLHKLVKP